MGGAGCLGGISQGSTEAAKAAKQAEEAAAAVNAAATHTSVKPEEEVSLQGCKDCMGCKGCMGGKGCKGCKGWGGSSGRRGQLNATVTGRGAKEGEGLQAGVGGAGHPCHWHSALPLHTKQMVHSLLSHARTCFNPSSVKASRRSDQSPSSGPPHTHAMLSSAVPCFLRALQVKHEVEEEIEAAKAEPMPSPFEVQQQAPDAFSAEGADQAPDHLNLRQPSGKKASLGRFTVQDSVKLMSSRSLRRMPSVSRRDSLAAVGSGCVSTADIHHLEAEVDVEVVEPIQE